MSIVKRVVKNSLVGVVAEALSGGLTFVVLIISARYLGAKDFGTFSYILAIVGIFQLIADFGLTNIVVREVAKAPATAHLLIGAVKPLAWFFSLLTFFIIAWIAYMSFQSHEEQYSMALMGVAVLATFHSVLYGSVCRGFEEMGFNALGNVLHKIVLLALVLGASQYDLGMLGLAEAHAAANWLQWMFFYLVVSARYFRIRWHVDWAYCRHLLLEAFPVGIAMVLRRVTMHLNTLLLTLFTNPTSVGLFNAAYKVVQMVDMIPFTLSIPLYPPLARLAAESSAKMYVAMGHALRAFLIVAVPLACWMCVFAQHIMDWTFGGAYQEATSTLRFLSVVVVFLFPTSLFVYAFSAIRKQRLYALTTAFSLITNAILGVALVPYYGVSGIVVAILMAELMCFAVGALLMHHEGARIPYLRIFGKPVLAALVAVQVLYLGVEISSIYSIVVSSVAYAALYSLLCLLFRAVRWAELEMLGSTFRKDDGVSGVQEVHGG